MSSPSLAFIVAFTSISVSTPKPCSASASRVRATASPNDVCSVVDSAIPMFASVVRGITQHGEAIPVLGLTDLAPREPCGKDLVRRRGRLRSLPVASYEHHQTDDPGCQQPPEQDHADPMPA